MTERVEAEANIFAATGTVHAKVFLYAAPEAYDENGVPSYAIEPDLARVAAFVNGLKQAIEAAGLELGREAPRAYGGGAPKAPRPEDPPPAGVPVPEHDGQPCIFKPAFTNPKTSKPVSAKFACRLGDACTGKVGQYPWSVWLDAWLKSVNEGE